MQRRTVRFTLGPGPTFTLRAVSPREQFRALAEILAIAGPSIAGLLSGAGIRLADDRVVPWAVLMTSPDAMVEVAAAGLRLADKLDSDRLLRLAERLVVGSVTVEPEGGKPVEVSSSETLDAFLPDGLAWIGLLRHALALNVSPTLAGRASASPAMPQQ